MIKIFNFEIKNRLDGTLARTGVINTPHGCINTPAFIVGGTNATVRTLSPEQVEALGGSAVLANSYHLMLRPGVEIINQSGGIHRFMNWNKPIFTDSGGFQIFSLGVAYDKGLVAVTQGKDGSVDGRTGLKRQLIKVTDKGVHFKSHLDGSKMFITPERSMEIQHLIGADIHMCFDELTSPLAGYEYVEKAMNRTHLWAERCLSRHIELNKKHRLKGELEQALYGVVQGAREETLRRQSAQFLGNLDFDGYGIGGVFEPQEIPETVYWINETLPDDKPRHLLGMGSQPADLFLGVEYGIDTFDCVAPTRQARNGALFTYDGRINIKNSQYKTDFTPIDKECGCYTCQHYTKAYLSHLFRAGELLGFSLASIHNEYFVVNTVERIRKSIIDNTFFEYKREFLNRYYKNKTHEVFYGGLDRT